MSVKFSQTLSENAFISLPFLNSWASTEFKVGITVAI